jgi:integrase
VYILTDFNCISTFINVKVIVMLEKSFGLLFYLKKPKDYQNGAMPVYLRITVDGEEKELSTKRCWEPARWNAKANRAKGVREDCRSLNEYLDDLQNKVYDARQHLIQRGKLVTAVALRDQLAGKEQRQWMLVTLFTQHNDELAALIGNGVSKGTWTNFNTSCKHLTAFLKAEYGVKDINILSLDLAFIKKYYHWFRITKKLCHNSTLKNIANMKKIVLDCVDNGWLLSDPFAKFAMTRDEVETVYLTKEELQAIATKKIPGQRLSRVRDLFIFCCFTGLSFIDVKQLKRSEVSFDAHGGLRIAKQRQKTGTPAVIPLLPVAKSLLQKYAYDEYCNANDLLLPVLSNQKYNAYLKELADMCYVEKELSSKMARNTFATTVTLANNVPMESISKMMGHKSLRQTQHYAKVLAIKVTEDMEALNQRLVHEEYFPKQDMIEF